MTARAITPKSMDHIVMLEGCHSLPRDGPLMRAFCSMSCRFSSSTSLRNFSSVVSLYRMDVFRQLVFQPPFMIDRDLRSQITINNGDDEQRRHCGENQPADDGPSERRI